MANLVLFATGSSQQRDGAVWSIRLYQLKFQRVAGAGLMNSLVSGLGSLCFSLRPLDVLCLTANLNTILRPGQHRATLRIYTE